ncbi:MAG: hypothetical protein A3B70_03450 [Deltaproteobacteria bacterium RIFCSPHIGHO2_02_FULL_40_11]|nr:MAG: hypothetical protein A3B70_03450 [Deltaproteobacteria bacterium RIFCSPHIGHO2_02_FULL_40_11]
MQGQFYMFRIFIFNLFCFFMFGAMAQAADKPSVLILPPSGLFSHPNHKKVLEELGVSCTDCHNFSIKNKKKGPLVSPVPKGFIKPSLHVCHQCHFGRVNLPRPNQCEACHVNSRALRPQDHYIAWKNRHGKMAQMDRDRCKQCHTQNSCDQCHLQIDTMNPSNHPASFRLYHSVEARMNPQSCVTCHQRRTFCSDCHFGRRQ